MYIYINIFIFIELESEGWHLVVWLVGWFFHSRGLESTRVFLSSPLSRFQHDDDEVDDVDIKSSVKTCFFFLLFSYFLTLRWHLDLIVSTAAVQQLMFRGPNSISTILPRRILRFAAAYRSTLIFDPLDLVPSFEKSQGGSV